MNKLHDNIISSLVYLDNKTSEHFMISEENNHLLQPLKKELKEDFNNYANKTQRNLVQINENIASVYGRSTSSIQEIEEVIEDVQENVKALYTYLKGVLPEGKNQHFEVILDKLQRIEEYTKMFKGWQDGVKPELKSIQNALTSMMKAIKPVNEKPKNQDAETARAIQDVHPSNNDAKTTGTAKSGTSQAGTTVPSTDDKSDTSVIEIVISLQNSTKTSDDADEQAVHSLQKLSGENAGTSQNGTMASPTDNNSTKPAGVAPEKAEGSLQNSSEDAGTSQNGTTVPPTDNNSATTVAEKVTSLQNDTQPSNNLAEKALLSNVNTGTLQNVTIVPPKDENKSTLVEAVTSPQNGTKPSTITKNAVVPLQNALKGNTTSQNGTEVPTTDNENKSTVAEVQNTLKANMTTLQGTAVVPGTLQNDTTAGVTPMNNITEPSNGVPENVEASSQNSLIGNIETFGTTENENTVVTMITPFENSTQPSNDSAPENVHASSENALKGTTVTVVKSLENTTELSSDAPETVRSLQNVSTVSSDGETRKITETTTALVTSSTAPSHDESGITDNEPGKNADKIEKPSKSISTIPTDNGSDEPDIASTTPLPKSSKAQSSDSEDDFSYRTLQAPN
nr:unnamed protein product [Callosobruchus chinensis]